MPYSTSISAVTISGSPINAVGNASVSYNRPPLDVTEIGKKNTYVIHGVSTATMELDLFYSTTDHSGLSTNILAADAPIEIFVVFDNSTDAWGGDAIVTSFDVVAQVGDVVRAKVGLVFNGSFSIVNVLSAPGALEDVPA